MFQRKLYICPETGGSRLLGYLVTGKTFLLGLNVIVNKTNVNQD
jgi:hypothetical protein